MEKQYRVIWTIDQYANSPEEAIAKAILAMPVPMNQETTATVFTVVPSDAEELSIDTYELEGEERARFVKVLDGIDDEEEGTEGQDRKSYSDDQDRESYT